MAKFILGMLITDIQGSVGGTTLRRTPSGHIMYNKQGRQIKSAYKKNNVRAKLATIIQSWGLLSESVKNDWNNAAALVPVKDKFSNIKYLTGRQLYIKCNTQLIPIGSPSLLSTFDTVINQATITMNSEVDLGNGLVFDFDVQVSNSYLLAEFYTLSVSRGVKPHAHFKKKASRLLVLATEQDFTTEFLSQFPNANVGQYFGVNLSFVNEFGLLSPVQSLKFVIAAV